MIRHCYADISKAHRILEYQPHITLSDGITEMAEWLKTQIAIDQFESAHQELLARKLAV